MGGNTKRFDNGVNMQKRARSKLILSFFLARWIMSALDALLVKRMEELFHHHFATTDNIDTLTRNTHAATTNIVDYIRFN